MMGNTHPNRETWLNAFIDRARPVFKERGYTIPDNVRASVGWSSKGSRSNRIGECWTDECSEDGTFEIFIVPSIGNGSRVADILTHELVHATVGIEHGHKAPFVRCMKAVGLEGKPTSTIAGQAWHDWADDVLDDLGPIPHAALTQVTGLKKQTTRMIKCECADCGFVFRTTATWLEDRDLRCPDAGCRGFVAVG